MLLDWRTDGSLPFARCFDAETGDPVPGVLRYDTATHDLTRLCTVGGRVVTGGDGSPAVVVETRRLRVEWHPLPGEVVPDPGAA